MTHIHLDSESSVTVTLGESVSAETQHRILAIQAWLQDHPFPGFLDAVPAFTTLTVHFDPVQIQRAWADAGAVFMPVRAVAEWLEAQLPDIPPYQPRNYPMVEIPVRYGGQYGTDLSDVAALTGLSEAEVMALHSGAIYTVAFIGFSPGFPYLTGLPEVLELPRFDMPKKNYPAGSVAIAGRQTCVYPQASNGGWRIIGQTDFTFFDANVYPPARLAPGMQVRFCPM